jgi:glycosyltransferase involved in cell wall biosynthesis
MSLVNLIAEPTADLAPAERITGNVKSVRRLRLCILSHPRYNEVAGHLPEYLSSMVQEACRREWSVNLLVPPKLGEYVRKEDGGRHANLLFSPHWPTSESIDGAEPSGAQIRIKGWFATIRAYCLIAAKGGCDHLLIIDGDQNHTAFAIGLVALPLLRCGVSTVVFGSLNGLSNNSERSGRSLKQKAGLSVVRRFFRMKTFRGIITTNPALASSNRNLPEETEKKVRYVKEIEPQWKAPLPMRQARSILGIDQHWRVVLCYGALGAEHKGLPQLFAAVDHADMKNVLILLVGSPNASTLELLNSSAAERLKANKQIQEVFGYASSERERAAFSASDAVWIGCPTHKGPSGVLEIARTAGVPIVASSGGVIGWTVEHDDLGSVTDVTDPQQTRLALSECFSRRRIPSAIEDGPCVSAAEYRGFGKRVCDVIDAFEKES